MIGARMAMWQSYGEFEGLTVEAVQAGTFSLKAVPPASIIEKEPQPPEVFLQSSLDGGTTLQEFVAGESKVQLDAGKRLCLRATPRKRNLAFAKSENDSMLYWHLEERGYAHWAFDFSGSEFDVSGKLKSIFQCNQLNDRQLYGFGKMCFAGLFAGSTVRDASGLELPAVSETATASKNYGAFHKMFGQCQRLTACPDISQDEDVGNYTHDSMFRGCTALKHVAEDMFLSSGIVNAYSCSGMFMGCVSLTAGPKCLPYGMNAAYSSMFSGCTSLQVPPKLSHHPTVCAKAYAYMFKDCTSLVEASELPATELGEGCYAYMFQNCKSLARLPDMPSSFIVSAQNAFEYAFFNCPLSGYADGKLPPMQFSVLSSASYALQGTFYASKIADASQISILAPDGLVPPCAFRAMFWDCKSLSASVGSLPGVSAGTSAFAGFNYNCPKLSTAPAICCESFEDSATGSFAQAFMYTGVSRAETRLTSWGDASSSNTTDWLKNAAATGTFAGPQCLLSSIPERNASYVPES